MKKHRQVKLSLDKTISNGKICTVDEEGLPKQARLLRKEKIPMLSRGKAQSTARLKARFINI